MNFKELIKDFLIEDYRNYKAVNYSLLKEIHSGNFESIRDGLPEITSSYMDFGSYIDKTIEQNEEPKDLYVYSNVELSEHSKILVDELIKRNLLNCGIGNRLAVADELNLWSTTKKVEKRELKVDSIDINVVLNREIARREGKTIISKEDLELAKYILNVLYTHEYSKDIVNSSFKTQILKQLALKFVFNKVECKILLDLIQVNTDEKTIQPIDLKTGSEANFLTNFYKYKYFLQGPFYYLGLLNLVNKIPELKDYKILPFKFLYISREKRNLPIQYSLTQKAIEKYIEGYIDRYGEKKKGIIDLLEDYKFHKETGIYDRSRELYENGGVLTIPEP